VSSTEDWRASAAANSGSSIACKDVHDALQGSLQPRSELTTTDVEDEERLTVAPLTRAGAAQQPEGPLVLVILDGVGVGRGDEYDAVAMASTPVLDQLEATSPMRTLRAHGRAVGLGSDSDMGNSEVGHNTLGAGRVFDQGANQVDKAIATGQIWTGAWRSLIADSQARGATLHFIGLLSDGGVHSSITHLFALLERAAEEGVARVRVHVLLDGRDVPDFSALEYLAALQDGLDKLNGVMDRDFRIASGGGRMVTTMDRYGANWGIVAQGWAAHVLGKARPFPSAVDAVRTYRAESPGVSDQDLPAFTVVKDGRPVGPVENGDVVVVFNFRGDRAIEISEALTGGADFAHFDRQRVPEISFASMTCYDVERGFPERFLVHPERVDGTISEYLAASGISQFACAETQKFGHVTYFWNGNRSEKFDPSAETYVEIQSDQVPFQTAPAMKSAETADLVVSAVAAGTYDFIRTNFAGGDMVGHTADFAATCRALESIDTAIGEIAASVAAARGCLVITADHGNAEDMVERDNQGAPVLDANGHAQMKTAHSLNPVMLLVHDYAGRNLKFRDDLPDGGLANVAATLVQLLGFIPPAEYEPTLLTW
jgi:2,3-bisphosphoglycerate-independent phosphoglycerate mutase